MCIYTVFKTNPTYDLVAETAYPSVRASGTRGRARDERGWGWGWGAKYHLQGQSRIGHPPSSGASRPSSPLGPPRLRFATPPAHPSTRRDVVRRDKEEGGG